MNRISGWSDILWEEWTNISKYHFHQNITFGVKMIMQISWVGVISKCLFKSKNFRYTPIQTDVLNCFDNHNKWFFFYLDNGCMTFSIRTVWFIFTHLNISGQTAQFINFLIGRLQYRLLSSMFLSSVWTHEIPKGIITFVDNIGVF